MRTPATFGRFLRVAFYALCFAQLVTLGIVFLITLAMPLVTGSKAMPHISQVRLIQSWLIAADVVLSVVLVSWAYVRYQRGDLDEYSVRRGSRR